MAIIILGSSECSLCGKVLEENDDITLWSAFLNKDHKFWRFSDSGMHTNCFEKWENKDEFEYLYQYQPLVDFNAPHFKKLIEDNGMPEWLRKIKEFRKKAPLHNI